MTRPDRGTMIDWVALTVGVLSVQFAVEYGSAFSLGWWWVLFWIGVCVLLVWVKAS